MTDSFGGQLGSTGIAIKGGNSVTCEIRRVINFKLLAIVDNQIDEDVVCWCSVGVSVCDGIVLQRCRTLCYLYYFGKPVQAKAEGLQVLIICKVAWTMCQVACDRVPGRMTSRPHVLGRVPGRMGVRSHVAVCQVAWAAS